MMQISLTHTDLKSAVAYSQKYAGSAAFPRLFTIFAQYVGQPQSPGLGGIEQLASYDLHIGNVYQQKGLDIKEAVAKIRALNPKIKLIDCVGNAVYLLAEGASIQGSKSLNDTFPEAYFLRDIHGQKIVGWPENRFLFDLSKPGAIDAVVELHLRWYERSAAYMDGLFVDCVKPEFPFWAYAFDTGQNPQVDLGDGKPADRETLHEIWAEAILEIVRRLRSRLDKDVLFFGNQADLSQADLLNGVFLEDYMAYPYQAMPSCRVALFEERMAQYFEWCRKLRRPSYAFWTMPSGIDPGYHLQQGTDRYEMVYNAAAELRSRMRFGLAASLMNDGYYSYDIHTKSRGAWFWFHEYGLQLGYPISDARQHSPGVHSRPFQGGWAVINASNQPVHIQFAEPVLLPEAGQTVVEVIVDELDGLVVAGR